MKNSKKSDDKENISFYVNVCNHHHEQHFLMNEIYEVYGS